MSLAMRRAQAGKDLRSFEGGGRIAMGSFGRFPMIRSSAFRVDAEEFREFGDPGVLYRYAIF
ncbi:MAG: hypothetical protein ACYDC3_00595 [Candidatus Binataceae bacterium]